MRGWPLLAVLIALPTLLPLAAALTSFTRVDAELWSHLSTYVLPQVLPDTLILLAGVSLGVSVTGAGLAVLVSMFSFPGRRFFAWALLLPMAMPAYVLGTVFVGNLDYAGTVASWLRDKGVSLPELRNGLGAGLVLIAALYPYVYLVVRSSLVAQGARVLEAAQSMGLSPVQSIVRVVLPLAAPAIAGGTLLASMETLADFGTVAAFNYDTFTSAIYKAWFALFSVDAALQLAGVLLALVVLLLVLQGRVQAARRVAVAGPHAASIPLPGARGLAASAICLLVLVLAFVAPAMQLLVWALRHRHDFDARMAASAFNSLRLGVFAALLLVSGASLLGYAARRAPGRVVRAATRVATLGYALPGALLAVGLYVPLAALTQRFNQQFDLHLVLQGGLALMLMAYAVRFMAVAHAPVMAGLARIRPSLDEAAQLAGVTGLRQLQRVHLPLLRPGLAAACALVLVDVMKEMPITLMTRPFGWDTLAVRVFELTSEGQWQRAALPSLFIVVAGLIPVAWLTRQMDHQQHSTAIPAAGDGPAT
ncbi:MAG: ABC transporter permease [Panacagrimonas sp.]